MRQGHYIGITGNTEIVEAQQGQAGLIDGIIRDVEDRGIEPVLQKAWLLCVQHMSQMPAQEVIATLGLRQAVALSRLSPAERYVALAQGFRLRINGLSAVMARVWDFQKLLALLEAVKSNPVLLQAFLQRYSADKLISRLFKTLNIDPESLEADEQEVQRMQQLLPLLLQQQGVGQAGRLLRCPACRKAPRCLGRNSWGARCARRSHGRAD
jgi:hypothetical protein